MQRISWLFYSSDLIAPNIFDNFNHLLCELWTIWCHHFNSYISRKEWAKRYEFLPINFDLLFCLCLHALVITTLTEICITLSTLTPLVMKILNTSTKNFLLHCLDSKKDLEKWKYRAMIVSRELVLKPTFAATF